MAAMASEKPWWDIAFDFYFQQVETTPSGALSQRRVRPPGAIPSLCHPGQTLPYFLAAS